MKKDDLVLEAFLKQFKSHEELTSFLKQIQKRGIEKMLEGELDGHLDYDKHQKSAGSTIEIENDSGVSSAIGIEVVLGFLGGIDIWRLVFNYQVGERHCEPARDSEERKGTRSHEYVGLVFMRF